MAAIRSYGSLISAEECERCLQDLAIILPRAGLDKDDILRMLDLHWGLYRKHGMTAAMLVRAAEAYVMAPKKGKPRFFPDPGELYELAADDARDRKKAIGALMRALEILDGNRLPAPTDDAEPDASPEMLAKLRDLAASLSTKPGTVMPTDDAPKKKAPVTSRPCTDADELKAALDKRLKKQAA